MNKNPFKIGDKVVVTRAKSEEFNGIEASVIGLRDDICQLDYLLEGQDCNLCLLYYKLDLLKEDNEI